MQIKDIVLWVVAIMLAFLVVRELIPRKEGKKKDTSIEIINKVQAALDAAVLRIDSTKMEVNSAINELRSAKESLLELKGEIDGIEAAYLKEVRGINLRIRELKEDLKTKQVKVEKLQDELIKLK